MMTLADLSREKPNPEEIAQLFALMDSESDRGCALVAGSLVEAAVEMAVACRMVDEPNMLDPVFLGSNAPAGSFSSKIKLAFALGMFGPVTAERLNIVREIRNAFAHALRPLEFNHKTLVVACDRLCSNPLFLTVPDKAGAREKYLVSCKYLFKLVYQHAQKEGDKEVRLPTL